MSTFTKPKFILSKLVVVVDGCCMGGGDHCCVWGCENDRRYPEKQIIKPHVGILRFYSPLNENDRKNWNKLINRLSFTAKMTSKVCSNHFSLGYRCKTTCRNPTLYMKGYEESIKIRRPPPKTRNNVQCKGSMKRKFEMENASFLKTV